MSWSGLGVWLAAQGSFRVLLFHASTYDQLLEINVGPAVAQKLQSLTPTTCSILLADRTATQYDRLLATACRPSVCQSVCEAVHCGSHGRCTGLKVVPACS